MKLKAIVVLYMAMLVGVAVKGYTDPPPIAKTDQTIVSGQDRFQFVYFGAEWCQPCRQMQADTLSNASVKKAMDKQFGMYVTVMDIDVFKKMAEVYKVVAVPTYVILDGDKEIKRGVGYRNAADFLNWLKVE